jgi:hypothetical protein
MVLLYGIPGEGPIELVANELEEAELPFIFFNPRHFEELDSFQEQPLRLHAHP